MVSVLSFYSKDPSSNPAEGNNFSVKLYLKRVKINKKRPVLAHLKTQFKPVKLVACHTVFPSSSRGKLNFLCLI